jgi:hypothetical protein
VLSDVLFIASALLLYEVGKYIGGVLVSFSFLEAAFGFCAGCHVYSFCRGSFLKEITNRSTSS